MSPVEISNPFRTVPRLFDQQVRRTPDAVAVVCGDRSITYGELAGRANRLARYLQNCGVAPDTLVGVALDRSIDMVVALLAVLKAGGAYVPIDPSYPAQRIALVLEDSRALAILTTEALKERLPVVETVRVVCLDIEDGAIATCSAEPLESPARPHHLAYVIYTSGSTGKPKGVMVEHRNVASFFAAMDRVLDASPGVWLAVTSVSFDISVLELFWTLVSGFRVILHPDRVPDTIPGLIERHGVTHLQSTPSLARLLASDPASLQGLRPLRKLLLGGEALP
ncbi:MAG: AMP-binding protein, partial [Bryobacteraceae bacterium]